MSATNSARSSASHADMQADLLCVRDLGQMAYADAFALQQKLQQQMIAQRTLPPNETSSADLPRIGYLLLVEHVPPVITVSRRRGARKHLLATPQQLAAAGVEVAETDRGGDITYHGPGQLVVYPILDLNVLHLRLHEYMRLLEQIVIETLAQFEIQGHRDPDATGVWVDQSAQHVASRDVLAGSHVRKICAMGVRIARWVSMHGLALNVATNLEHFQLIVPCGLHGRAVTSMQEELGTHCPTLKEVQAAIVEQFRRSLAARLTDADGAAEPRDCKFRENPL